MDDFLIMLFMPPSTYIILISFKHMLSKLLIVIIIQIKVLNKKKKIISVVIKVQFSFAPNDLISSCHAPGTDCTFSFPTQTHKT